MLSILGRLIILAFVIGVEIYFYQAVWTLIKDASPGVRSFVRYSYFVLSGLIIAGMIVSAIYPPPLWPKYARNYFGSVIFLVMLCQLVACIPLIADDLVRLFRFLYEKFLSQPAAANEPGEKITRLKFFSWLSMGLFVIPGAGLFYGIVKGAHRYKKHYVKLSFPDLPAAFHGTKIVQLSDMHTGSFVDDTFLRKAFGMVMEESPDMIFFTGDLVNNLASETDGFTEAYKLLKAPLGVYSVLGNHDYGDYVEWDSEEAKKKNLDALVQAQKSSGWDVMLNENRVIEKNGERIALLGIENCPFRGQFVRHRYGDLKKTMKGAEDVPFKILLSHDPSHWDKQVSVEQPFRNIQLTLSGHTHGMQMGIEIPGFKWSPVKYIYPQWAGLYKLESQYLYVNRGLGYIGYNGRLGIWPEITVIELYRGESGKGYESTTYSKI